MKLHDYGCSLKVFRAEVVKPMKLYGEMHRFLPAIASEFGVEIGEQVVNHRARTHGKSNYGITRTLRVVLDLMTVKFLSSYSTRPLQMFGSIGLVMGGVGSLMCAWVTYQRFFGYQSANRPLLIVGAMHGARRPEPDHERPAGGDAGAHIPRVAGQADLRHPGDPGSAARAAAGGGGVGDAPDRGRNC